MVILFIVKIIDNIILTAKSITTYKNQEILSVILTIISQFMFYFVVKQILLDETILSIIIISLASGIGAYIAFKINNKFKKDILWMNILTCKSKEDITRLSDYLIENNIKYIVNDSYSRSWESTYSIIIFSNTKEQSRKIDKFLEETSVKYLRQIIK